MSKPKSSPLRVAGLISGGGTTLLNLQRQSSAGLLDISIPLVLASRECPGVQRCQAIGLSPQILSSKEYSSVTDYSRAIFNHVRAANADLVVLAGFLSMIEIPDDYAGRVMNIHPSLIPAFCGKGMYGHHVHQAVVARGCKVSGCTVHFCDNQYDHGPIILQKTVPVFPTDNADTVARRVNEAEAIAYPEAISLFAAGRLEIRGRHVHVLDE